MGRGKKYKGAGQAPQFYPGAFSKSSSQAVGFPLAGGAQIEGVVHSVNIAFAGSGNYDIGKALGQGVMRLASGVDAL